MNLFMNLSMRGDILEKLCDEFKSLKPYRFEPGKEVITDTDKSEEDSVKS